MSYFWTIAGVGLVVAMLLAALKPRYRPRLAAVTALLTIIPAWFLLIVAPLLEYGPKAELSPIDSWDPPADWVWMIIVVAPFIMLASVMIWHKPLTQLLEQRAWPWLISSGLYVALVTYFYLTN